MGIPSCRWFTFSYSWRDGTKSKLRRLSAQFTCSGTKDTGCLVRSFVFLSAAFCASLCAQNLWISRRAANFANIKCSACLSNSKGFIAQKPDAAPSAPSHLKTKEPKMRKRLEAKATRMAKAQHSSHYKRTTHRCRRLEKRSACCPKMFILNESFSPYIVEALALFLSLSLSIYGGAYSWLTQIAYR